MESPRLDSSALPERGSHVCFPCCVSAFWSQRMSAGSLPPVHRKGTSETMADFFELQKPRRDFPKSVK